MGKYFLIFAAFLLLLPAFCLGEEALPPAIAAKLDQTEMAPKEKYDTTAIVPVPDQNTQTALEKPVMPHNDNKGFQLLTDGKEDVEELPQGTIAVYIDIEEAFNKNPWTIQARKNIKLDLETKQIEYAQLKDKVRELKLKEESLYRQMGYYKPFYENLEYIEANNDDIYPKLSKDELKPVLNTILFCSCDTRIDSPANTPVKTEEIKANLKDTKKEILEKETFLLNFKELSKEEILSRQDLIIQAVLKEIYTGIKEYAALRNIGIVVDKQEIIYGKPLNITPEFVKWMKSYHKKYKEQYGDIL